MSSKILLIDDDTRLRNLLARFLSEHDIQVYTAHDETEMQRHLQRNVFDMYLLDINLPGRSGLEICQHLRQIGDKTPLIMLTARSEDVDRITGLEIGADDYVAKPFNPQELLARIRSLFRRSLVYQSRDTELDVVVSFDGYTFDGIKQQLRFHDERVNLSQNQLSLLKTLILHQGQAVSRIQLCHKVYGREYDPESRDIDMLVSSLRKQLNSRGDHDWIRTVRGVGYKFLMID